MMPMWNAIGLAPSFRAGLAGLALVILPASLAQAFFGPRTTIGTNYQQLSTTEALNAFQAGSCDGFAHCYVLFQPIPHRKPLIVERVACRVDLDGGGLEAALVGTRKRRDITFRWAPLVPVHTTGTHWAVNSPTTHLLKSGERPYVLLINSASADWDVSCSISGQLQQP